MGRRPGQRGWRRSLTRSTGVPIFTGRSSTARAPGRSSAHELEPKVSLAKNCRLFGRRSCGENEESEAVMANLTQQQQRDFEAHAFRTLVEHLRNRTDVQNIDLMNLAGFCR